MSTHAPRAAAVAVLVALVVGGCSSDEPAASPRPTTEATTTTVPSSTTTSPRDTTTSTAPTSDEEAILAAVDGFFTVLYESSAPPDPDHPDLERYLMGAQLERTRALVQQRGQLGQSLRRAEPSQYGHNSVVAQFEGDAATVTSCAVDDLVLIDRASEAVLNDAVLTHLWTIQVRRVDGQWKVADTAADRQWDGAVLCE